MALQQPQGSELKDTIRALQRRIQNVGLGDVTASLKNLDARILQRLRKVLGRAADEIVVDHDLADIRFRELIYCMRADEARAPDDDDALSLEFHCSASLVCDATAGAIA